MGFVNGNRINDANVNQHVVTVKRPPPRKAKKAATPKPEPKPEVVEVKAEEAKESAPAES